MKNKFLAFTMIFASVGLFSLSSCKKGSSSTTGWEYNNPDWGGFEDRKFMGQETGPGLVFIPGGTFVMGNTEQDVMFEHQAFPRRITVSSFYMDETEVRNLDYREYLYWLGRTFGTDYPEIVKAAEPDQEVWRDELAYNEPYVEYYFTHPAYDDYPVVGVDWEQAMDYCEWRTDRVNEMIMVRDGFLELNPNQVNADNFNTDAYLANQYEGVEGKKPMKNLDPNGEEYRKVQFEDGILLPDYRLPTEAEWEYAALALIGNLPHPDEERVTDRRIYPWNGTTTRYYKGGWQGDFLANFKRGRGDNMGLAGNLNDNASITAPVDAFYPNDFGLFNMAGNVSEWVLDVYRPLTFEDAEDFNTFRGNVFKTKVLDDEGNIAPKNDTTGKIEYRLVTDEEVATRRNYRTADVRDYLDGDNQSLNGNEYMYNYGVTSLVNNESRVYKGGSWNDRAYYLSPGTRRYLDQKEASSQIGFRCAMIRVGSPSGNQIKGGNNFKKKKKW
ncbi:MAG: SUMF1/EgtB/PvdO family nonheme iron enzyme [Chitinophagales bacterium]|nr:SUMF1/EgtB/PvdO family nonheme iron enzyme [Chitinophagales bacterium]